MKKRLFMAFAMRNRRVRRRLTQAVAGLTGGGAIGGAAIAYFFDPQNGKRRRKMARDRTAAMFRRPAKRVVRATGAATQMARDHTVGAVHETRKALDGGAPELNDQELANRVRTEIFRPRGAPKSSVSVNAENGVVYLRGEVKRPEQIKKLVEATQKVDGVVAVESLLHTPKTPAPTKA